MSYFFGRTVRGRGGGGSIAPRDGNEQVVGPVAPVLAWVYLHMDTMTRILYSIRVQLYTRLWPPSADSTREMSTWPLGGDWGGGGGGVGGCAGAKERALKAELGVRDRRIFKTGGNCIRDRGDRKTDL
jgi:hypothetical protein